MACAMRAPSPLEDPETAAHAWGRYRRILRATGAAALVVVAAALAVLYAQDGPVSIHLYIAAALGIGGTVMLGGALMGLVFLSNGTGHDAAVAHPPDEDGKAGRP